MQTPLKIDFCGAEPSEVLHGKIVEFMGGLESVFGRMTACPREDF